jgi:hypothetical protein
MIIQEGLEPVNNGNENEEGEDQIEEEEEIPDI